MHSGDDRRPRGRAGRAGPGGAQPLPRGLRRRQRLLLRLRRPRGDRPRGPGGPALAEAHRGADRRARCVRVRGPRDERLRVPGGPGVQLRRRGPRRARARGPGGPARAQAHRRPRGGHGHQRVGRLLPRAHGRLGRARVGHGRWPGLGAGHAPERPHGARGARQPPGARDAHLRAGRAARARAVAPLRRIARRGRALVPRGRALVPRRRSPRTDGKVRGPTARRLTGAAASWRPLTRARSRGRSPTSDSGMLPPHAHTRMQCSRSHQPMQSQTSHAPAARSSWATSRGHPAPV
mmetsp:Transcript_15297/g.51623  ORF Transcript_15297/g.51623 Transcript_15297/m.51623 type:complete len:293 (+) Transcript_15297:1175-2053(+)